MYTIAVVEDEKEDRDILLQYLRRYGEECSVKLQVDLFRDGLSFISDYNAKYDVVIMDIEMPHMDGMRTAEKLRKLDESVSLMFITNMAQYAIKGYEVNAKYFVLKPIDYFSFYIKLNKMLENCDIKQGITMRIQTEEGVAKVHSSKILYLQSEKHNIYIVTANDKYKMRSSMKEMEAALPKEVFFRCDNSYLVNLAYVSKINLDTVKVGRYELPVSRPRRKDFINSFTNYLGDIQ